MSKNRASSVRRPPTVRPPPTVDRLSPSLPNRTAQVIDRDIARRAYDLYLARGCEHGHDVDDWLQAIVPHDALLNRLRAEFLEMPGLRLKVEQVRRLCGIEQTICQMVLDLLVDEEFLCIKGDGHYARSTDGGIRLS